MIRRQDKEAFKTSEEALLFEDTLHGIMHQDQAGGAVSMIESLVEGQLLNFLRKTI